MRKKSEGNRSKGWKEEDEFWEQGQEVTGVLQSFKRKPSVLEDVLLTSFAKKKS